MISLITEWIRITPGTEDRDTIVAALWLDDDRVELHRGRQHLGRIHVPIGGPCLELTRAELAELATYVVPQTPEVDFHDPALEEHKALRRYGDLATPWYDR